MVNALLNAGWLKSDNGQSCTLRLSWAKLECPSGGFLTDPPDALRFGDGLLLSRPAPRCANCTAAPAPVATKPHRCTTVSPVMS